MVKRKKPKQEKKVSIEMKEVVCYAKVNDSPEEEGYSFYFIPSEYKGIWLKVWECYDYTVGVDYASSQENEILNRMKGKKQ